MAVPEGTRNTMKENGVRMTSELTPGRRNKVNQYTRHERIGKGQHGEVFLCMDELGGELALKVVKRNHPRDRIKLLRRNNPHYTSERPTLNSTEHSRILREIAIMKRCRHANIARLFEVIDDPQQDKIYLVMEFLAGGEVRWTDLQQRPTLSLQETRRIVRDVILGLEYLHHRGIIHRDIKPANLLWTKDRAVVKIIDFGVAYFNPESPSFKDSQDSGDHLLFNKADLLKRIGTPSFLAPEVVWFDDKIQEFPCVSCDTPERRTSPVIVKEGKSLSRPPITKAIDVWSLAVTFYCLLFGHTPFNVPESANGNVYHNEYMLYTQICTEDWDVDETMGSEQTQSGGRHPIDPKSEGYAIVNLLDRMLQKDPKERVTLSQLKRAPWILSDIPEPEKWLIRTSPTASNLPTKCRWMRKASRRLLDLLQVSHRYRPVPAL